MDRIRITGYAEVTDTFQVKEIAAARALSNEFVWNDEYLRTRFNFKPRLGKFGSPSGWDIGRTVCFRRFEKSEIPHQTGRNSEHQSQRDEQHQND